MQSVTVYNVHHAVLVSLSPSTGWELKDPNGEGHAPKAELSLTTSVTQPTSCGAVMLSPSRNVLQFQNRQGRTMGRHSTGFGVRRADSDVWLCEL